MTYIPRILRPKRPRYTRLPDYRFGTFDDPTDGPAYISGWRTPYEGGFPRLDSDGLRVVELGPREWLQPDARP